LRAGLAARRSDAKRRGHTLKREVFSGVNEAADTLHGAGGGDGEK
jgi:hypothetical protein